VRFFEPGMYQNHLIERNYSAARNGL